MTFEDDDPPPELGPVGGRMVPDPRNLEAALLLAQAGLPVFPVRVTLNVENGRWDKRPCFKGWQDKATADEAAVRSLWQQFPKALPGIALGNAKLVVLDADRHGGPDGVNAFKISPTATGSPMVWCGSIPPELASTTSFATSATSPLGMAKASCRAGSICVVGAASSSPQAPSARTGRGGPSRRAAQD